MYTNPAENADQYSAQIEHCITMTLDKNALQLTIQTLISYFKIITGIRELPQNHDIWLQNNKDSSI